MTYVVHGIFTSILPISYIRLYDWQLTNEEVHTAIHHGYRYRIVSFSRTIVPCLPLPYGHRAVIAPLLPPKNTRCVRLYTSAGTSHKRRPRPSTHLHKEAQAERQLPEHLRVLLAPRSSPPPLRVQIPSGFGITNHHQSPEHLNQWCCVCAVFTLRRPLFLLILYPTTFSNSSVRRDSSSQRLVQVMWSHRLRQKTKTSTN